MLRFSILYQWISTFSLEWISQFLKLRFLKVKTLNKFPIISLQWICINFRSLSLAVTVVFSSETGASTEIKTKVYNRQSTCLIVRMLISEKRCRSSALIPSKAKFDDTYRFSNLINENNPRAKVIKRRWHFEVTDMATTRLHPSCGSTCVHQEAAVKAPATLQLFSLHVMSFESGILWIRTRQKSTVAKDEREWARVCTHTRNGNNYVKKIKINFQTNHMLFGHISNFVLLDRKKENTIIWYYCYLIKRTKELYESRREDYVKAVVQQSEKSGFNCRLSKLSFSIFSLCLLYDQVIKRRRLITRSKKIPSLLRLFKHSHWILLMKKENEATFFFKSDALFSLNQVFFELNQII